VLKFLLILFLPTAALAEKIPSYLIGGEIQVKTNDGIKRKYSADEYKMVTRESAERARLIVEKLRKDLAEAKDRLKHLHAIMRSSDKRIRRITPLFFKNRFTVHAGLGPAGLERRQVDGGRIIKPKRDPVMGMTFSRRVYKNMNLSATGISSINIRSATFVGGIGFDF
jgi:hypothetical protein